MLIFVVMFNATSVKSDLGYNPPLCRELN